MRVDPPQSGKSPPNAGAFAGIKWSELRYFLRFCLVGVVNTTLTLAIIVVLFRWGGVGLVTANAIGYLIGICFSFFANRAWTFAARDQAIGAGAARFLLVTAVAYGSSLGILALMYSVMGFGAVWSQIVSTVAYTCLSFGGSRLFAFKPT